MLKKLVLVFFTLFVVALAFYYLSKQQVSRFPAPATPPPVVSAIE